MFVYDDSLKVFHSTLLEDEAIISGFATRMAGDGRKRSTVLNFCENNAISYDTLIVPDQIHSVNVEAVSTNGEIVQVIDTTDGVVTATDNVLLTVVTADCVPMIFADNKNGVVGISHQGWRGTLKMMGCRMIDKMVELGANIENITVAIGPSIGACCYEIYGDRLYDFLSEYDDIKDKIINTRGDKTHLNLNYLNFYQLSTKGIKKKNIDFFPFCTRCDENRFFSFQRDEPSSYGEMFSYIIKKRNHDN